MLRHALKEWAVICHALADGRQIIILRKGGIFEIGAGFRVENRRFWLFPTYLHQQASAVVPEASRLLREVETDRPAPGVVRLSHYVEVHGIWQIADEVRALSLRELHVWSDETVRQRFRYRHPGIFALAVRLFRVPRAVELPNTTAYEGCRSWVELAESLPTDDSVPVLSDAVFAIELSKVQQCLGDGHGVV